MMDRRTKRTLDGTGPGSRPPFTSLEEMVAVLGTEGAVRALIHKAPPRTATCTREPASARRECESRRS